MHFTKKTITEKRSDLVKKLQSKKLLRFPGAYNPLCAKLIAEIGFDGVYVSGGVMSNDLGLPDIGLTTMTEVTQFAGNIAKVTSLPTIMDVDTGFGEMMNVVRTIQEIENAVDDKQMINGEPSGLCQFCRYQTKCQSDGNGIEHTPMSAPKGESDEKT